MDVEPSRNRSVDLLEEGEDVVTGVALAALGQHLAGLDVEGAEQIRRAVALVVMRHRPGAPAPERQARLGPVERLNLGLLVEGEGDGTLCRVQIEADDVDELFFEVRIARELEGLSTRQGLTSWSFQIRCTVSLPMPKRVAIVRVDQRVEASGGDCSSVAFITATRCPPAARSGVRGPGGPFRAPRRRR